MNTTTYLDQILEPVSDSFTKEFAEAMVNLRLNAVVEQHVDQLREKASQGTLTAEEDRDYKAFVEAVDIVGVLQSKARQFLKKQSA